MRNILVKYLRDEGDTDVTIDDITQDIRNKDIYTIGERKYLVCNDIEAEIRWTEALEEVLEGFISTLPELSKRYFDKTGWSKDARYYGRGNY